MELAHEGIVDALPTLAMLFIGFAVWLALLFRRALYHHMNKLDTVFIARNLKRLSSAFSAMLIRATMRAARKKEQRELHRRYPIDHFLN